MVLGTVARLPGADGARKVAKSAQNSALHQQSRTIRLLGERGELVTKKGRSYAQCIASRRYRHVGRSFGMRQQAATGR
jgi:hypothetical protein